ncbi:MAG: hypothetical protein K1X72_04725 [Pyrinomonadaceae bacterium]|nr:hypothetical protein [Pyrinomonadaceae bacterium]
MKNKINFYISGGLILLCLLGCNRFQKESNNSSAPTNSNSTTNTPTTETPKNFEAGNLLISVKSQNSEVAKLLKNKEIYVSGEVWSGGNRYSGPFSFEFWNAEGRISCNGNITASSDAKAALLDKLTNDYLNKRTKRMPLVKAKGIFKEVFPPAEKPNDFWKIIMENCEILDVQP